MHGKFDKEDRLLYNAAKDTGKRIPSARHPLKMKYIK